MGGGRPAGMRGLWGVGWSRGGYGGAGDVCGSRPKWGGRELGGGGSWLGVLSGAGGSHEAGGFGLGVRAALRLPALGVAITARAESPLHVNLGCLC